MGSPALPLPTAATGETAGCQDSQPGEGPAAERFRSAVDPQDSPDRPLRGHLCCPSAGSYPSDFARGQASGAGPGRPCTRGGHLEMDLFQENGSWVHLSSRACPDPALSLSVTGSQLSSVTSGTAFPAACWVYRSRWPKSGASPSSQVPSPAAYPTCPVQPCLWPQGSQGREREEGATTSPPEAF